MLETILLCTIFGVFIIIAYTMGLKNGQKLSKNETIEVPNINPVKAITKELEEHEEKKQQRIEDSKQNILRIGRFLLPLPLEYAK